MAELEAAWQGFLRALAANYLQRVPWFRDSDIEHAEEESGVKGGGT